MTKPEHPVVEALEGMIVPDCGCGVPCDCYSWASFRAKAKEILPLARELVEYKEGLEYLIMEINKNWLFRTSCRKSCPAIIKRMIGERHD